MERRIFHVDVNSAFLSWEAARRVARGEADLRLVPSAIGGDRDKRTGVILAKSIPAKAFHITTGEPVAAALQKCPQLVLAKPDFHLYKACSRAFMEICSRYAPVVEKFSIDECFLDMTGTDRMYPDPLAVAYAIRDAIRTELGFTVNIGVSRNKLLAKMASDFEKPDRVHTLFPEEIPEKFWPLPVGELFSVGSATAGKLNAMGIHTIGDLAHTPLPRLQAILGKKAGRHLHAYANGLEAGFVAETDLMERSLKAQLKYANKIGARYTMVIGDSELAAGAARLKNMDTGEEQEVPFAELEEALLRREADRLYDEIVDAQLDGE